MFITLTILYFRVGVEETVDLFVQPASSDIVIIEIINKAAIIYLFFLTLLPHVIPHYFNSTTENALRQ